jgi:hypothetical protein
MKLFAVAFSLLFSVAAFAGQIQVSNQNLSAQGEQVLSYNFGTVWANSRSFARFTVTNTGTTPLTFADAVIYGGDFRATHSCRPGLLPNEKCFFEVEYWPMFEGMSSGRFILSFVEDRIVVDLWGQSRRM